MLAKRIAILKSIGERRNSSPILYVTGDRPGLETQIGQDIYDCFVNILDTIGFVDKISLILYTRGGNAIAAWSIVNLIKQFCNKFEVILPHKAQSAGTLISIGACTIVMTKQATLGPIDPSIITPLNPQINNSSPLPVNVEEVNGFLEFAKSHMNQADANTIKDLIVQLSTKVHPLVLGAVHRSKTQIKVLAKKLISNTSIQNEKIDAIVAFLCSESGSHDYTIHRHEAQELGLLIEEPDQDFYTEIKSLYDNFSQELKLTQKWNLQKKLKHYNNVTYQNKRGLLESINNKKYCFTTQGRIERIQQGNTIKIANNITSEGWVVETH